MSRRSDSTNGWARESWTSGGSAVSPERRLAKSPPRKARLKPGTTNARLNPGTTNARLKPGTTNVVRLKADPTKTTEFAERLESLYTTFDQPDAASDPVHIVRRYSAREDREVVGFC